MQSTFPIFKDLNLNDEINFLGYVKLPILNEDEINFLKKLYHKWHPESPQTYYRSFFSKNREYKNEVEKKILEIVAPKIEKYFRDYICTGGMYVVKPHSEEQTLGVHQDYSFVDEIKHWSLNMWLPLVDTDYSNGTMQFLPRSHQFLHTIRGYGTPEVYNELIPTIEQHLKTISCKAGEGLFFFHNIVHGSTINKRLDPRICIGVTIIQKNVPVYFFRKLVNKPTTEVYEVNPNFFIEFFEDLSFFPVSAKYVNDIDYKYEKLSPIELLNKINAQ